MNRGVKGGKYGTEPSEDSVIICITMKMKMVNWIVNKYCYIMQKAVSFSTRRGTNSFWRILLHEVEIWKKRG
jgi:hypothetical protein